MTQPSSGTESLRVLQGMDIHEDQRKKTIVIYSPDLNFGFSLTMLLQDRYNVITTTNPGTLRSLAGDHDADLVLMDAVPSGQIIERIDALKAQNKHMPVILLYVFDQRSSDFDRKIRNHVDAVFYKPLDISAVSARIQELLMQ